MSDEYREDAYVLSEHGEKIAMHVKTRDGLLPLTEITPIAPNVTVTLNAEFNAPHGIPAREFFNSWKTMYVTVKFGGMTYLTTVDETMVAALYKAFRPNPIEPGPIKRQTDLYKAPPLPPKPNRNPREAKLRSSIVELARNWLNGLDTLLAKCPRHLTIDREHFLRPYVPSDFDIPKDGLAAIPLHEISDAALVTAVLTLWAVMGQIKKKLDDIRAEPVKASALDDLRGQRTPAFNAFASVLRIVEGHAAEKELSRLAFRA